MSSVQHETTNSRCPAVSVLSGIYSCLPWFLLESNSYTVTHVESVLVLLRAEPERVTHVLARVRGSTLDRRRIRLEIEVRYNIHALQNRLRRVACAHLRRHSTCTGHTNARRTIHASRTDGHRTGSWRQTLHLSAHSTLVRTQERLFSGCTRPAPRLPPLRRDGEIQRTIYSDTDSPVSADMRGA